MASVVFLRAVNVGRSNRCQPAAIAKELGTFGVINIGAVGTFVVRKNAGESTLRNAFANQLGFKTEIIIIPARNLIKLASTDPFSQEPASEGITRFVNVLARRVQTLPALPLTLPSEDDWLLKVIAIQDRFVLGVYRRHMKAIRYLGNLEKIIGIPATNRNWNTIDRIVQVLRKD